MGVGGSGQHERGRGGRDDVTSVALCSTSFVARERVFVSQSRAEEEQLYQS